MNYSCIIWDWNGTLLNDAFLCRSVMNDILRKRSLPVMSSRRYEEIFDFPVEVYYERLGFNFSTESFEKLGTEFIASYERRKSICRLQANARNLLRNLQHKGAVQALLSAYRHDTLVELVASKGLSGCFDTILGADDHYARGKEEQGRVLFKKLKPSPPETLLIGDTVHDFEVARAIGVDCLLIHSGHQSKSRLEACGCTVLEDLTAAERWIMGSR